MRGNAACARRIKGDILFRKREYPLWNPKRKASIASEQLEELQCLPIASACVRRGRICPCYTTWCASIIRCRLGVFVEYTPISAYRGTPQRGGGARAALGARPSPLPLALPPSIERGGWENSPHRRGHRRHPRNHPPPTEKGAAPPAGEPPPAPRGAPSARLPYIHTARVRGRWRSVPLWSWGGPSPPATPPPLFPPPPPAPQGKCKNLLLRFQRPALSQDPRQDRAQRSDQEADDADDHIERNFLLEEKKREDRRQDGL